MTVPLPETGDGSRRRRRQRRSARRAVGRIAAVAVLVAVAGGVSWLVVDGADARRGDDATDETTRSTAPPAPAEPPALVVLRDGFDEVYGITVFAPATGTILHVPPGTLVEAPSLGLVPVREVGAAGNDLLEQSLENLLGVGFGDVVVLDPARLIRAIDEVDPLTVEVTDAVEDVAPSGRVTVVVPAGRQQVAGEGAVAFLHVIGRGTTLDRLARHQSFWSSYLESGAGRIRALRPFAGTSVRHRVLPVEPVSGVDGTDELYRVDEDALAELVTSVFPDAVGAGTRFRVQILNGVGVAGVAQRVQPLLVEVGGRMTLSGNADRFDYETTQVVYYDDADLTAARTVQAALGVGEVVKSLAGLEVVDVTVVVGADFLSTEPGG